MQVSEKNRSFTQLIEFQIEPRQQLALVAALSTQSERLAQGHGGFINATVQRVVMAALKAAQYLERVKGHRRGLVGADQRPEIFLAMFKAFKRRLTVLTGAPLQVIEHPPPTAALNLQEGGGEA